jgi:hypothetical protein
VERSTQGLKRRRLRRKQINGSDYNHCGVRPGEDHHPHLRSQAKRKK